MKLITKIINFILGLKISQVIVEALKPARPYSWKTMIGLGVFSWIVSLFAVGFPQEIISTCGWFFFIFGVSWAGRTNEITLSDWLIGALVCIFIFSIFTDSIPRQAIIFWPPISAIVAGLPYFIDKNLNLQIPPVEDRLTLVILFMSQILLSCWLQFGLLTQDWLAKYPSLLTEDFSRSTFVVRWDWRQPDKPKGAALLNLITQDLQDFFTEQSWSQVELWLLREDEQKQLDVIVDRAKQEILQLKSNEVEEDQIILGSSTWEGKLWKIESEVKPRVVGYSLDLKALWEGPRSRAGEYYIEKKCIISPSLPTNDGTTISFKCNAPEVNGWQNRRQKNSIITQ